jgi:hypothetical protein
MKDRFGLPLSIDDIVFYSSKSKEWSGVTKIVKFTSERVTILDPWMESSDCMQIPCADKYIHVTPDRLMLFKAQIDYNKKTYPELFI